MPNNDLGTAHGRIRIDLDDQGSVQASAALLKVQKEFQALEKKVAVLEKQLAKSNSTIKKNSDAFSRARDSSRGFSLQIFDTHKIVKAFDKDLVDLTGDLVKLYGKFSQVEEKTKGFRTLYKLIDNFTKLQKPEFTKYLPNAFYSMRGQVFELNKGLSNFYKALQSINAFRWLKRGLWDAAVANSMKEMPMWTRSLYGFATGLTSVAAAGALAGKALEAGFIKKFLNTNVFRQIVNQSRKAGLALGTFGAVTQQFFGRLPFKKLSEGLMDSEKSLSRFVNRTSDKLNTFSRIFNKAAMPIDQIAKTTIKFTVGVSLLTSGVRGLVGAFSWLGRIPKPLLGTLATILSTVLPAALQVLGKSLVTVSNILAGLLDGVKQLGGGLAVLPGFIAQIGVISATIRTIFFGISDQFKDIFSSDPLEAAEAFAKLPEHLKPLATALKDIVVRFKEMQIALQKVAFKDVEKQIKALGDTYFPILERNMNSVTVGLRGLKDNFVAFIQQSQTQKDVNQIFQDTTEVIGNVSTSLIPLGDALRDIAAVGSRFIADLSGGLPGLSQRFAEFARVNRENGNMTGWMRDSRQGIRDITVGTKDLLKGLWEIVTVFKTDIGSNWLDSYAKAMERFVRAMSRSSLTGFLFELGNMFKGLSIGRDAINMFLDVMRNLGQLINSVYPVIQNIADAFSTIFVPAIHGAMWEIKMFAEFMTSLGLDRVTGYILGIVAAFEILPTVLGPVINGVKSLAGLFITVKNAGGMAKAIEAIGLKGAYALEQFGSAGKTASESIVRVTEFVSKFGKVVLGVTGAIAAIVIAFYSMVKVVDYVKGKSAELDGQLEKNTQSLKTFQKSLTEAFYNDNGMVGRNVTDQVTMGLQQMMTDLDDTAKKAPNMWQHIVDAFGVRPTEWEKESPLSAKSLLMPKNPLTMFNNSDEVNRLQDIAGQAQNAKDKLEELAKNGVDLNEVLLKGDASFNQFIEDLRNSSEEGKDAADVLERQRQAYDEVYASMQRLGPMGVQLANGIKMIAEAGGEAQTRLEGLKMVLQGLGFLKVDAIEAAMNYTTAIGTMADRIQQAVESAGGANDIWDKSTNTLNKNSKAAAAVWPIFREVSNAFLTAANAGENVDDLFVRLDESLGQIADSLGTSKELLREYFRNNLGAAPTQIKLALQLEGKEQLAQELGNFLLQLSTSAEKQVEVRVGFNVAQDAFDFDKELERILGRDITDQEGGVNGLNVVLKPGIQISPEEILKLQQVLATYGIQTGNGPVVDPAKIPVAVTPAPNAPVPAAPNAPPKPVPGFVGGAGAAAPSGAPVPAPVAGEQLIGAPAISSDLNNASDKIDEIEGKMQGFAARNHKIQVDSEDLENANTRVDNLVKNFADKKIKTSVEVAGVEKLDEITGKAQAIADKFTTVFNTLKDKISEAVESAKTKTAELSQSVIDSLNIAAQGARDAGSKFVEAFAQGLETNPRAVQAAADMAERVLENFHRSPPKRGPLAEHGDAAKYGGARFVDSYATGLRTAAPRAADAAGAVAGAAGGALGTNAPGASAGQFFQQFLELTNFASSLVDIFTRVSDSVFQFAKFISDPMGKGTFFGGSLGFKRLNQAELKRRRDEQDQQGLRSAMDGASRDDTAFQRRLEIITNAENAVVSDSGGKKSQEAPKTIGAMIKAAFPEIASIGGARPDAKPYHNEGRALDIMIPEYNTKEGKALGDRINAWALANAEKIGLTDTIWQDFYQPADGSAGNFMGNTDPTQGHYDHVHLTFAPGAAVDMSGLEMTPGELEDYAKKSKQDAAKTALEVLQEQYGPPALSASDALVTRQQARLNPTTGQFELFTPEGQQDLPDGYLNPETKKPWTVEEAQQYVNENPEVVTLPDGMTMDRFTQLLSDPNFVATNQEETLNRIGDGNEQIAKALQIAQDPRAFDNNESDVISALTAVDNEINRLTEMNTPGSRLQAQDLSTIKSTIMDQGGYAQNDNPIDTIAGIASNAAGVASDIIGTIVTGIESIGAADDIAKTLSRGVANTKDVDRIIDNAQKFLEFGAKVSGSVASVSGLIGSVVGAGASADPSGGAGGAAAAIQSISTIASLVQAGFETANAVIDITQEAMRIAGTYVGDFLGYLVGAGGGQLTGTVRFLLDKQTNQLLTYTAENAMDKRISNVPFVSRDMDSREQLIGNINVYGGPGSDPRDLTRQMMFQVNSAQYAGALAQ